MECVNMAHVEKSIFINKAQKSCLVNYVGDTKVLNVTIVQVCIGP